MKKNILEYLRETADNYPNKIALIDEHNTLTFKELNCNAMSLATEIINRCGNIQKKPIAVYMEKGIDSIVAFMAIVYSGNYYIPIDKKSPWERIQRILDTLEPIAIISKSEPVGLKNCIDIGYSEGMQTIYEEKKLLENVSNILDIDPLYVLFTSGSTGIPKGVIINHKSVIDYTEWLHIEFRFDENTIFGEQAPFYFDNSILDIYSTLKNAATMVIIPEHYFSFPIKLFEFINEQKINTIFWVPSALIGVANSGILKKQKLQYIEKILFCGEVMPNKQLNLWREVYPEVMYANLYGPTEITDVCSFYVVNRKFDNDEPLPIGKACNNTEIIVLNEQNKLVEENEIGELCVRGTCLSLGYYGDFEKTDNVFVQNPLNTKYYDKIYRTGDMVKYNEYGELVYICRKDFQIKHQGHRIELGEIETVASAIDTIQQCCVLYNDKEKKIVMFYTSEIKNEKEIYLNLKNKLPRYMLPSEIHKLEKFPLNLNGKIDRVALRSVFNECI